MDAHDLVRLRWIECIDNLHSLEREHRAVNGKTELPVLIKAFLDKSSLLPDLEIELEEDV